MRLDLSDEEMKDWILENIKANDNTITLDMKYFAQYQPHIGFKFSVDGIIGLDYKDPFIGVFCCNPPASLYTQILDLSDVSLTKQVDFDSFNRAMFFQDVMMQFKNYKFDPFLHMIVDVRSVDLKTHPAQFKEVG